MYGSLGIVFVIGTHWLGLWILLPLGASVLGYSLVQPFMDRVRRPEYLIAATIVNAQVLTGVAIILTGGSSSPAIPILLLVIITLPARFPARGVIVGVLVSMGVLIISAVVTDPSGFAADPTYTLVGLAAIAGIAAFSYALMSSEIQQRSDATIDPLTGLLNRHALASRFAEIADQAEMSGAWVAIIECDLDYFKRINDRYGHDRGDAVLKDIAYALRRNLRSFELVYRLGGEEFLIVMPGGSANEGRAAAERIRREIERSEPGGVKITASLGVAAAQGSAARFEEIFRPADAALYQAKRCGRNRVVVAANTRTPDAAPLVPVAA